LHRISNLVFEPSKLVVHTKAHVMTVYSLEAALGTFLSLEQLDPSHNSWPSKKDKLTLGASLSFIPFQPPLA
jgi:hypothetical protein